MNQSDHILELARHRRVLRAADVREQGWSPQLLIRLHQAGKLHRLGRGLYALPDAQVTEHQTLIEVCQRVPKAVLCLLSALQWHEIGTQLPHEVWVALPEGTQAPALGYPALRGANQLMNASGALAALEALRERIPVTAQAVRNGLAMVELPGRFQIVPGQPALVLDVAHNPHSVAALTANLDAMGYFPTTHAVFGAMADKDLTSMLTKLLPLLDRWYFTDLPLPRAAKATDLMAQWQALNTRKDTQAAAFASPMEALQAAIAAADPADRIVVFG